MPKLLQIKGFGDTTGPPALRPRRWIGRKHRGAGRPPQRPACRPRQSVARGRCGWMHANRRHEGRGLYYYFRRDESIPADQRKCENGQMSCNRATNNFARTSRCPRGRIRGPGAACGNFKEGTQRQGTSRKGQFHRSTCARAYDDRAMHIMQDRRMLTQLER